MGIEKTYSAKMLKQEKEGKNKTCFFIKVHYTEENKLLKNSQRGSNHT